MLLFGLHGRQVGAGTLTFTSKPIPTGLLQPAACNGPVTNEGVNFLPPANHPDTPKLTPSEQSVLALGPQYIPVNTKKQLDETELECMMSAVRHNCAVMINTRGTCLPSRTFRYTAIDFPVVPAPKTQAPNLHCVRTRNAINQLKTGLLADMQRDKSVLTPCPLNLTTAQSAAVRMLRKRTDIVVRPADKGLGATVMSKSWYINACNVHLRDASTYSRLCVATPEALSACVKKTLDDCYMHTFPHLQRAEFDRIFGSVDSCRIPRFYCLPKLHKITLEKPHEARPIVSVVNGPTSVMSSVVSSFLNKVIGVKHQWILRDTLELLDYLDNTVFPRGTNLLLVTLDVVSLYPSLNRDAVVDAVMHAVSSYCSEQHLPAPITRNTHALLYSLLKPVLFDCKFTFCDGDTTWLYEQTRGAAMGSPCIPNCANIFMAAHVAAVINKHKEQVLFVRGYLDDIFLVFSGGGLELANFVSELNAISPNIRFTHEASPLGVPFLDVFVHKGPRFCATGRLDYSPYVKDLNRFLYIPLSSAHPPRCLIGFVRGEARRLVRNSTNVHSAVQACVAFTAHLIARGYPARLVLQALRRVSYDQRPEYLKRKVQVYTPTLAIVTTYLPSTPLATFKASAQQLQTALRSDAHNDDLRVVLGWRSAQSLQGIFHLQWPQAAPVGV